jgi:uncharacterized protein (DUF2384 family)
MRHSAVYPMLRSAEVIAHATSAMGRENAMAWLQKPNSALGNVTPLDIFSKGEACEVQQLDDQLTALEYGMFT